MNSYTNRSPSLCPLHRVDKTNGEKRLLIIIGISLVTMVGEIVGGTVFGSMALLADGWHMGTHVLALGIAFAACVIARKFATDRRFGFGPSKVSALGGFAGAVLLGVVAFEMVGEGVHRLLEPEQILFTEAIVVAVIGLLVNTVGAVLLHDGGHSHEHADDHGHSHESHGEHAHSHHAHGAHGHDANMRSAYLHVITDALTSVLAIGALLLGRQFGWLWADAVVAMLGGVIILKWAYGLLKDSGATLLDFVPGEKVRSEVETTLIGNNGNQIADLHLWPQGAAYGLLATIVSHRNRDTARDIHHRLSKLGYIDHITVEVRPCDCCQSL